MIKRVYGRIKSLIRDKNQFWKHRHIYRQYRPYTMIPEYLYCQNLRLIEIHTNGLKGDIVECGVWRGGMIAGISQVAGINRNYYLFDSFEGLPPAKPIDGKSAISWQENTGGSNYFDNCSAEIEFADKAMKSTGAKYSLHKGWFNETLGSFESKNQIAVLRLDADWYNSTIECLTRLYPLVCENGLIILDDYYTWDGCSRAVHDYLSSIKSASRISSFNGVCFIIKKTDG